MLFIEDGLHALVKIYFSGFPTLRDNKIIAQYKIGKWFDLDFFSHRMPYEGLSYSAYIFTSIMNN